MIGATGNGRRAIFQAPANNGGKLITSYYGDCIDLQPPLPRQADGDGKGSPLTITHLSNGDRYTFTVKATNASAPARPPHRARP